MKIVLIGKNGQLGWEFQRRLPVLGEVIAFGRSELDISNLGSIQTILTSLKPALIINASAYTEVDRAEKETDLAMRINSEAPGVMAEAARKLGAVFVHYSTDYVFDGKSNHPYKEDDPVNPLNVYGKSKLRGEQNIRQTDAASLIIRTSWVYSIRGNGFVNKVLAWSRKNKVLKIVNDQIGCPTWAGSLAAITINSLSSHTTNLLDAIKQTRGVYHLAGDGYTSRYEWAKAILANDPNRAEQMVETIEPVPSGEFPTPATRPLFSVLDCSKFTQVHGQQLPAWQNELAFAMLGYSNNFETKI